MKISDEQTTDVESITRVRARYASEMNELHGLGFRELCFRIESLGPFSLLTLFPILLAMRSNNEVTVQKSPLRIAAAYALMTHQEFCTYAEPLGLGVKFYTGFTDGLALVTSNFMTQEADNPRLRKMGRAQPLQWAWGFHQKQIEQLRTQGHELQARLTFDDYSIISKVEIDSLSM
jgi:hypothetical protein